MILFYNIFLKHDRVAGENTYYRGLFGYEDTTLNIFKYSLTSVAELYPWKKIIINCKLDENFQSEKENLKNFIENLFPNENIFLNLNDRCTRQSHWKKIYEELNDDIILFFCNHDHIFVDSNTSKFKETVEEFRNEFSNKEASLYISHWPEICMGYSCSENLRTNYSFNYGSNCDSVQIITKKLFESWWFSGSFEELYLPRTDWVNNYKNNPFFFGPPHQPIKPTAAPYREFFKHYDGYTHIENKSNTDRIDFQKKICSVSPPLKIPHLFFDQKIKIYVGFDEIFKDGVNCNINKNDYSCLDKNGSDFKMFITDLPFFLKNNASIILNSNYDEQKYKTKRDSSIMNPLFSGYFNNVLTNELIIKKIKCEYNIPI